MKCFNKGEYIILHSIAYATEGVPIEFVFLNSTEKRVRGMHKIGRECVSNENRKFRVKKSDEGRRAIKKMTESKGRNMVSVEPAKWHEYEMSGCLRWLADSKHVFLRFVCCCLIYCHRNKMLHGFSNFKVCKCSFSIKMSKFLYFVFLNSIHV